MVTKTWTYGRQMQNAQQLSELIFEGCSITPRPSIIVGRRPGIFIASLPFFNLGARVLNVGLVEVPVKEDFCCGDQIMIFDINTGEDAPVMCIKCNIPAPTP